VTFADTTAAGSVYFAKYLAWQGECREKLLAEFYPEFAQDLRQGFGMTTEFVHQDFFSEATLFTLLRIKLTVTGLTRSRIEFEFEFVREPDGQLLGRGKQAVIWTSPQHRPSLMPDKLYHATADYFGLAES
jgi:enediyne biosynthesis thioesterase